MAEDAELDVLRSLVREHVPTMKLAAHPPYPDALPRRGLPPGTVQAMADLWTDILLADLRRNPPATPGRTKIEGNRH